MSIGEIIFFKTLVVATWIAIKENLLDSERDSASAKERGIAPDLTTEPLRSSRPAEYGFVKRSLPALSAPKSKGGHEG
jgi:hypothetical protein